MGCSHGTKFTMGPHVFFQASFRLLSTINERADTIPTAKLPLLRRRPENSSTPLTKGKNKNMPLRSVLFALLATSATAAVWNDRLKVWDIGQVPTEKGKNTAATYMGACGGIPEGGHVCGWYESDGVNALRAIYVCVNSRLGRAEVYKENKKLNRCVKNSRRKGKKFFPFNNGDQIVCQAKSRVEAP